MIDDCTAIVVYLDVQPAAAHSSIPSRAGSASSKLGAGSRGSPSANVSSHKASSAHKLLSTSILQTALAPPSKPATIGLQKLGMIKQRVQPPEHSSSSGSGSSPKELQAASSETATQQYGRQQSPAMRKATPSSLASLLSSPLAKLRKKL